MDADLPELVGLNPDAASMPLRLKHLISMAGGANVTYWQADRHLPPWGDQLRQGPPGTATSTSFWTISSAFLSSAPTPHALCGVIYLVSMPIGC